MTSRRFDRIGDFERIDGVQAAPIVPQASDQSLVGWTFDPVDQQGGTILPTAGLLMLSRIKVNAAAVTGIMVNVTAGGATLTAGQNLAALYNDAGAILGAGAVTADQSTAWQSTGLKTMALNVAQAVVPGAWYRVALFANGTTLPTLGRASNLPADSINAGMVAPTLRYSTANTGLTTAMPGSLGAQTASSPAWWVGLY